MRMVAMVVVIVMVVGCDSGAQLDDAAVPDGGSATRTPCTQFVVLELRWWRGVPPFIEPTSGPRIFVAGSDFMALSGESDPQPDGTTLVWAAKRYHFADGSVQLGAAGNRSATDTMCDWVEPVRIE